MTERQIALALKKIDDTSKKGCVLEALFMNYHLNINLLKLIYSKSGLKESTNNKKIKAIISELSKEIDVNTYLKSVVAKKNLKITKVWVSKMDAFIKVLKHKNPTNTKILLVETKKIFGILNISAHKIFAHK